MAAKSVPKTLIDHPVKDNQEVATNATNQIGIKYLILEDTNLEGGPIHLMQLFQWYEGKSLSNSETLYLLAFLVALECGFVPVDNYVQLSKDLMVLTPFSAFNAHNVSLITKKGPPKYKTDEQKTVFSMCLVQNIDLRYADENAMQRLIVYFTAASTGDLLLISLLSKSDQTGSSICLPVSRYILNIKAANKPFYWNFQKLKELSLMLKDDLFIPIRNRQMNLYGMGPHPGILGLPEDVYDNILQYLTLREAKAFGSANRSLQQYINSLKTRKNMVKFL